MCWWGGFCRFKLPSLLLQVGCAFALETSKDREDSYGTSPHPTALLAEEKKRGLDKAFWWFLVIHHRAQVLHCFVLWKIMAVFIFLETCASHLLEDLLILLPGRASPSLCQPAGQAAASHRAPERLIPTCRACTASGEDGNLSAWAQHWNDPDSHCNYPDSKAQVLPSAQGSELAGRAASLWCRGSDCVVVPACISSPVLPSHPKAGQRAARHTDKPCAQQGHQNLWPTITGVSYPLLINYVSVRIIKSVPN